MRNQINLIGLPWLIVFPSVVLAGCPVPQTSTVKLNVGSSARVTWAASSGQASSCLRGYQVCWTQTAHDMACDFATVASRGITLSGLMPCKQFFATVRAYNWNGRYSPFVNLTSTAGLPQITSLAYSQQDRNVTVLSWPSVSYSCVSSIHVWLCYNFTRKEYTGCMYQSFNSALSELVVKDLDVCRKYYVRMRTANYRQSSATKTFEMYLYSVNELALAKAKNVTPNSAGIEWRVSDPNSTCGKERMALCLERNGSTSDSSSACLRWTLGQQGPSDVTTLSNLQPCTKYSAVVTLSGTGKTTNRTVTFTTPLNSDAIKAAVTNVTRSSGLVTWSVQAAGRDCSPTLAKMCLSRVVNTTTNNNTRSNITSAANCILVRVASQVRTSLDLLSACTAYRVSLTVLTETSPQPTRTLQLVTTSGRSMTMKSMSLVVKQSSIRVSWVPTNLSRQCLDMYNISWSSPPEAAKLWKTIGKDDSNYIISPVTAGRTYYVDLEAVYVDGETNKLSRKIYTTSGSSENFSFLSTVFKMLPIIIFISLS